MQRIRDYWIRFKLLLLRVFAQIPLIGALPDTSVTDRREAFWELVFSQIISSMPIILGVLFFSWPNVSIERCIDGLFYLTRGGELFIYASSTLAPVIYIVTRDRETPRGFPSKNLYIALVLLGAILSAGIYALQRMKGNFLPDNMILISIGLFFGAMVLLYLALVYNNAFPPSAVEEWRRGEADMTRGLGARHKGV